MFVSQDHLYVGPDLDRPLPCPDKRCGHPGPLERVGVQLDGQAILASCPRCYTTSTVTG